MAKWSAFMGIMRRPLLFVDVIPRIFEHCNSARHSYHRSTAHGPLVGRSSVDISLDDSKVFGISIQFSGLRKLWWAHARSAMGSIDLFSEEVREEMLIVRFPR
jgi:hypothetical protein